MDETKKITAIFNSRENLLNILKYRGFNTEDYVGFNISEIHAMYSNKQLDILLKKNDNSEKVYIKYHLDKTFRPNSVHDIIEDLYHIESILSPSDNLIIVIKDEPNDTIQKLQHSIYDHDKIFLSIININRLQFNILNHKLVPKHSILTEEEKEQVKKEYNITDDKKFPNISRFDPVALVLGLRPGQLCKIMRPSKTAIISPFYRICSQ